MNAGGIDGERTLLEEAQRAFAEASTAEALQQVKAAYLGKQGLLARKMSEMQQLPATEKPAFGRKINALKSSLQDLFEERRLALQKAQKEATLRAHRIDFTLPPPPPQRGAAHPLREMERRLLQIFADLGYQVATGPEIESDFHNFEALNFPPDHPARDMHDTFMLEHGDLLRTHTSSVQIRTLLANTPPIQIVAPGAVYRSDTADATHSPYFHQIEGLVVDRHISMADLKGTLQTFINLLFPQDKPTPIRLRPSFFPFTEPSAEVDMHCVFCAGKGCRVCGKTGWIEILGAGMVHPQVFRSVGLDPATYTGFAFGLGLERIAMLWYGVEDIRLFFENDHRFSAQFR